MVCEFYHNKAVIQNNKINPHNQNYSKRKEPSVPPLSDQGSRQIACVGYWVTPFISEQSLPRAGSCIGSEESTVPLRTQGPTVTKFWRTGIATVLEKAYTISILYVRKHFIHKKINLYKIILGRNWAEEYPFCYLTLQSAVRCLHLGIHTLPCSLNVYVESDC